MFTVMTSAAFSPVTAFGADDLARLGEALDAHGVAAHELTLRRFIAAARNAGLCSPALEVLADPATIEPVRLRAFGRASMQYAARCAPRPRTRQRAA